MPTKINVFSSSKLLAAAAAAGIIVLLSQLSFFDVTERRFLDMAFRIRAAETVHPDIVIIEVNDQSLELMGSWPWPRRYHAALLQVLNAQKPSVVFFDMIFSENSNPEDDAVFAREIAKAGNVVMSYYFSGKDLKGEDKIRSGLPIPAFRDKAAKLGFVNAFTDPDGHIREVLPSLYHEGELMEGASLAMASLHPDFDREAVQEYLTGNEILVNFPGPYEYFNVLPYQYLLSLHAGGRQEALSFLKGKIVLVGHTATGTAMDLKPTPFSPQYPGVALQASTVHTILTQKFIKKTPWWALFIMLFLFAYLILQLSSLGNPFQGFLFTAASLAILYAIIQLYFQYGLRWVPYFGFLLMGSILYVGMTLLQFVRVRIEKEVMGRELSLASKIQQSFLPAEIPQVEGLKIAASTVPAKHVGGDLYDILKMDDGKIGVCIGDVSGKGIPAALYMAKSISEFRREADTPDTSVTVSNLNERLASEGSSGLFLTLLYVIIDLKERKISYSNGGHDPLFYYEKKTDKVYDYLNDEGLPLGIAPIGDFDRKERSFESGDIFLIETDGIKEAMNPKREQFGMERLVKAIMEKKDAEDPAEIVKNVQKHIAEFIKTAPVHDDSTIVCVKFL